MLPPVTVPMQTGAYMMPQAGVSGMFVLLMILAIVIVIIPLILFVIMLYKIRKRTVNWQGIFSSEDIREQFKRSNERASRYADKFDEMLDLYLDRERRQKGR